MTYCDSKLKIFTCNSNPKLAHQIADYIGIPMGNPIPHRLVTVKSKSSCLKVCAVATYTLCSRLVCQLTTT